MIFLVRKIKYDIKKISSKIKINFCKIILNDINKPLDKNNNFGAKLGSTIKLEYVLDLMTGICVAYIKINGQIRYHL